MHEPQKDRGEVQGHGDSSDFAPCMQIIGWFRPGESRTVEVGGVQVILRFVGRKGRRGRIAITAPAGSVFLDLERVDRANLEDDCSNA